MEHLIIIIIFIMIMEPAILNMTVQIKLLSQLNQLQEAIINDDIETIVEFIDKLGFDVKKYNPLVDYLHIILTDFIVNYIETNNIETLKIERKGVYNEVTYDWYKIVNNELFRNGYSTNYEVTRLYQAYKYIKNNTNRE